MDDAQPLVFLADPEGRRCSLRPGTFTLYPPEYFFDDWRQRVHMQTVLRVNERGWYLASASFQVDDWYDRGEQEGPRVWDKIEPLAPADAASWFLRNYSSGLPADLQALAYGYDLAGEGRPAQGSKPAPEAGPVRLLDRKARPNVEVYGEPERVTPKQWDAIKLLMERGRATNADLRTLRPALIALLRDRPQWQQHIRRAKGEGVWEWAHPRAT